jgi:hypothetical protein
VKLSLASLAAVFLALAAAAASAYVSQRIFERIPHIEDEFALLWQAHLMAGGEISQETPSLASSFIVPFVVDFQGQRFGKYPPGWPATLSLGARVGQPRLIQAILWGAVVWLTYRLGSKIASPSVGLLAGVLTLSSPMVLMISGTLMSHGLSSFLGLAFLLSVLDLFPRTRHGILDRSLKRTIMILVAGGSLGLLILTRPLTAFGIALPVMIFCGFRFIGGDREERRIWLGIGLLAMLIGSLLFLWQWALSGDPWMNLYTLWWPYDRLGFGPGIGVTESGHNLYWAIYNTRFSLAAGIHDLFGWPWLSWILLPLGLLALRKDRDGWLTFSVFPGLVLVYGFYWVGAWLFGPRYYVESVPGLAVISAAGIAWIGGWFAPSQIVSQARVYATSTLVIVLLVVNVVFYLPIRVGGMQQLYNIGREPMELLSRADLNQALVIVHAKRWFEYARYLLLTEPFSDSDLLIAWSATPEQDLRLIRTFGERAIYFLDPMHPDVLEALVGS